MLTSLFVQNYAIIESVKLDFDDGLNIITGETGAGKSILIGALNLVLGKRADTKVLHDQEKKCIVEATFNIASLKIKKWFVKHDLDYDEELMLRREIAVSGKSRAFINDTPVTIQQLQGLKTKIIDLHQQFDTLDIHDSAYQTSILDVIANNKKELIKYQEEYEALLLHRRKMKELQSSAAAGKQELDFITFQLTELEGLGLVQGEQKSIETELSGLNSVEDIQNAVSAAQQLLGDEEKGGVETLRQAIRHLEDVAEKQADIPKLVQSLSSSMEEMQDVLSELDSIYGSVEHNPNRLVELQDKLNIIYRLLKKHQLNDADELLNLQESLSEQKSQIVNSDEEIETLTKQINLQETSLKSLASSLSKKRKKAAKEVEKQVHAQLKSLGMANAKLSIIVENTEELNKNGMDAVDFLFAANKGGDLKQIKKVASGGEISRLNLSIKSLVAKKAKLPSLVFDEIDTGISGEVAQKMGMILHTLAKTHQIISITHSPQVSSRADKHFKVYKEDRAKRTVTHITPLTSEERIVEIAKMLSGDPPSKAAITNAEELIAG